MTKKDYVKIADILGYYYSRIEGMSGNQKQIFTKFYGDIIEDLCKSFELENNRFNQNKFIDAIKRL